MRRVTKMAEQRIALVTGGNRGIGLEVCRQLAGLHMRVILGSRDETKGVAAAKQLATAGLSVEARQLDVASVQSIRECMNWVRRDVGRLDILVNNAGIMIEEGDADPLEELEIVRETMQTNVYGPLLLSRLAVPIMHERALELGCMMSINPDAHSTEELDLTHWGVVMARKGGVPAERVLNALSLQKLREWVFS